MIPQFLAIPTQNGRVGIAIDRIRLIECLEVQGNAAAPNARSFVSFVGGDALTTLPIEEVVDELGDTSDWFGVTNMAGNQTLLRRRDIAATQETPRGTRLMVDYGEGKILGVDVTESFDVVCCAMSQPTYPDGPPGMQVVG